MKFIRLIYFRLNVKIMILKGSDRLDMVFEVRVQCCRETFPDL